MELLVVMDHPAVQLDSSMAHSVTVGMAVVVLLVVLLLLLDQLVFMRDLAVVLLGRTTRKTLLLVADVLLLLLLPVTDVLLPPPLDLRAAVTPRTTTPCNLAILPTVRLLIGLVVVVVALRTASIASCWLLVTSDNTATLQQSCYLGGE